MVGYYTHEFKGRNFEFCVLEMEKFAVAGQNPRVVPVPKVGGTSTHWTEAK